MIYYHVLTVIIRRCLLKEHDSYLRDILPCSDRCYLTMTTDGAFPHTWMIYYHALSVFMRRWQLAEHVSYMRDISSCSDRCRETMTTEGACFIPLGWITMLCPLLWDDDNWRSMFNTWRYITLLWPLSWDDDNWRSMFHTWLIYRHALTVVMRRWKLTEHVSYLRDISPWSGVCHETMTTDRACFKLEGYITMLWPLSWHDDNWQSMIYIIGIYNQALSFVMTRWQLTEHDLYLRYNYNALTVVVRRWKLTEHGL